MEDRVISDAQCLDPLKGTQKFDVDVKNEFSEHEIMDQVDFE